jgi:hypothetical protein
MKYKVIESVLQKTATIIVRLFVEEKKKKKKPCTTVCQRKLFLMISCPFYKLSCNIKEMMRAFLNNGIFLETLSCRISFCVCSLHFIYLLCVYNKKGFFYLFIVADLFYGKSRRIM